jgi:hypothetical protein
MEVIVKPTFTGNERRKNRMKTASIGDYFSDNPDYKFVNCYSGIPVFKFKLRKKESESEKTDRFWWGATIEHEKIIILGPECTKQDLNYALAYMLKFTLQNHFIICTDENAAASTDFR